MGLWRRAVAILVLMAFLPASVLAGTPLRICVGSDGHRAIEFVLVGSHHAESKITHPSECDEQRERHVEVSFDCADSPLLNALQKPDQLADSERELAFDTLLSIAIMAAVAAVPIYENVSEGAFKPLDFARRDSQLDALRTVVLLI